MSSKVSLVAEDRSQIGKGAARALRRDGKVPIIIYGKNKENVHASISERDLNNIYFKPGYSSLVIDIAVGKAKYNVIPRGVELHPVTDRVEHADFMYLDKNTKIKVSVHINFINEDKCRGIKRGGVFNIVKREIDLLCSADNIPENIKFDIANLDIGTSIHTNDITLPEGASLVNAEQNFTIATIIGRGGKEETEEETEAKK